MGMYEGLNAQPYFPQLYFSKLYSFKLFLALTSTNICELVDNFHCLLFNYFTIKGVCAPVVAAREKALQ